MYLQAYHISFGICLNPKQSSCILNGILLLGQAYHMAEASNRYKYQYRFWAMSWLTRLAQNLMPRHLLRLSFTESSKPLSICHQLLCQVRDYELGEV